MPPSAAAVSESQRTGRVLGQVANMDAALARKVCPNYKPGDQPSIAFLHIPKTAGDELFQA